MISTKLKFYIVFFLYSIITYTSATAFNVVTNGNPATTIVIPDKGMPSVEMAAKELQHHVNKASGATLTIVKESDFTQESGSAIYLGDCRASRGEDIHSGEMPRFSGVILQKGSNLFISGKDEEGDILHSARAGTLHISCGTLFAVYELLEEELDVSWLWPGDLGEFVPKQEDIVIKNTQRHVRPRLLQSTFRLSKVNAQISAWDSPFATKFYEAERLWLIRHRYCTSASFGHPRHSFTDYWEKYGATNPEFFNMLPDGTRRPLPPNGFWEQLKETDPQLYTQVQEKGITEELPPYKFTSHSAANITMCVSNPSFHQHLAEEYRKGVNLEAGEFMRGNILVLCENDSPGMCVCKTCLSWDAPQKSFNTHPYWSGKMIPEISQRFPFLNTVDGGSGSGNYDAPSLSDRYARFYAAVLDEITKFNPKATVIGYAYANYGDPPKSAKLNERVMISFVGWPMFPFTKERMRKVRENWEGWRATGASIMLRPNSTHSGHNMPIFYARELGEEYRYAYENGMRGTNFDTLTGQWAVQGPSLYVLGRLNTRPDLSIDAILEKFYSGFGKAAQDVRAYFEYWEQISSRVSEEEFVRWQKIRPGGGTWRKWLQISDFIFTPEVIERGEALLQQAQRASEGDPEAERRVAFLSKGLEHSKITLETLKAQLSYDQSKSPEDAERFASLQAALRDYRNRIEEDYVSDMGYLYRTERYTKGWWEDN